MAKSQKESFLKQQKIDSTTPLTPEQLVAIHDRASQSFMTDIIKNVLTPDQRNQYEEHAEKHK